MSLIIAFIGKKGCVMASDKRKIGYFGDKENLKVLEDELYKGMISNDDDFLARARELGVSIKITDDASKLKVVGNCVRGEVSSKGTFETRRKRIYGTANGYQVVELLGSETQSRKAGDNGLIIFGNQYAKLKAETLIKRKWKHSQSMRYMGETFQSIIEEIASQTPTVGKNVDVMIQQPKFDKTQAQKHLNITIDHDIVLSAVVLSDHIVFETSFNEKVAVYVLALVPVRFVAVTYVVFNPVTDSCFCVPS